VGLDLGLRAFGRTCADAVGTLQAARLAPAKCPEWPRPPSASRPPSARN